MTENLTIRPISGPDELCLFNALPYVLAAQDAPRIRAATDVGNVPMARAFERAGYANVERVVTMVWSTVDR